MHTVPQSWRVAPSKDDGPGSLKCLATSCLSSRVSLLTYESGNFTLWLLWRWHFRLKVIPARRHPRPSDTLHKKIIKFSIMDCSTHNARINLAVADLHQQEKPNFKATARKHAVNSTTLKRRYQGRQLSKQAASSEYRQCLTFAQEETLIGLINSLTDRGLPPTSQIVRNLAQEMIGRPVGKNWTGDFVKRYKNRLRSLYLRNIDSQRIKAEYAPSFK